MLRLQGRLLKNLKNYKESVKILSNNWYDQLGLYLIEYTGSIRHTLLKGSSSVSTVKE